MDTFLRFTVSGVAVAAVYAIAASGLVVTYATSGIFNFAHGAVGMFAAFTYWQFHTGWGWPTLPSVFIVVFVIAPIFGAVVDRVIMSKLAGTSEVVKIVVTVSLMLALLGMAIWIWPVDVGRSNAKFFVSDFLRIGGVNVAYHRIIILATAAVVALVLRLLLYNTRIGISMRAVVDDRPLVQLNGGRPERSSQLAWAIGSALAALAGILISAEYGLKPIELTLLVVNAYAAAVVGKLRSLPMTFLGALILGLIEAYVAGYLAVGHFVGLDLSYIQFAISPLLLFVVMVVQPQERLRSGGVQRTREGWRVPTVRSASVGALALVVVTLGICELMASDSDLIPLVPGFFFAIVALSLVPLTGYAGQVSLAQMSFAGIGGVLMAVVGAGRTPLGVVVAVVLTGLVGALIALPALRLSGIYLALGTAAFTLFMSKVVFNQPKVMPGGNRQVPELDVGLFSVKSYESQVMLLAITFAVVGVGLIGLRRSAWGRRLTAMKDSPVACATLGLDLTRTKIAVFALSASIAGLAGALWSRSISATDFELTQSMSVTMLAVVGGVGAVGGAFLGGLLLGTFNTIAPTLFATNAIGLFKFFEISVPDMLGFAPGFMGIGLGRNPSGAIGDIGDAYRHVGESPPAAVTTGAGLVTLWGLAKFDVITNWTFVAAVVVFVAAVVPLLPALITPPRTPRSLAAGGFLFAVLAATCALDWQSAIVSNGMRVVVIFATAAFAAGLASAIRGVVPTGLELPSGPSPDMIGILTPLTRSDVIDADVALGLHEEELAGHGTA